MYEAGTPQIPTQPAGTYAIQILNRLLIDLSRNSSHLEGNTYSLLDTTRLLEMGAEAKGCHTTSKVDHCKGGGSSRMTAGLPLSASGISVVQLARLYHEHKVGRADRSTA